MQNKIVVLSKFSIFIFLLINVISIKSGHSFGSDFAQYIIHAQNIIDQRPYASGIMLDLPIVVPPGYPLIIAPIIKFFGLNFIILKLQNIIFWFLSILVCLSIFEKRIGKGIDTAQAKGSREALILSDDVAVIANVKSRTIVTAIDRSEMKERIFTNIDSAVIV